MDFILETANLGLRAIKKRDAAAIFEMDSNPRVHTYLGNEPVQALATIYTVIEQLQAQYVQNGIARWAVILKENGECIGWSGLKYHKEGMNGHDAIYELGYRFKEKYWHKGYATEAGNAIIEYAKKQLDTAAIYAITHPQNAASMKVLYKLGFKQKPSFMHEGELTTWFVLPIR
jgi:ribosomal-protein-alanine N-acetyltransferase